MEYFETIVNLETGETTTRPYTKDEIAEMKKGEAAAAERTKVAEAKETSKAALLTKLGITADEAALLLS
jgi:hypothetical protein